MHAQLQQSARRVVTWLMGALGMGKGRAGAGGLALVLAARILITLRTLLFLILIVAMALLPYHMPESREAHKVLSLKLLS